MVGVMVFRDAVQPIGKRDAIITGLWTEVRITRLAFDLLAESKISVLSRTPFEQRLLRRMMPPSVVVHRPEPCP